MYRFNCKIISNFTSLCRRKAKTDNPPFTKTKVELVCKHPREIQTTKTLAAMLDDRNDNANLTRILLSMSSKMAAKTSLANDLLAEKVSILLLSSEEWTVMAFAFPSVFAPKENNTNI